MSFLLKIVEGPNKGAEIALVEGLCVTIGKADSCDIVLADPTLPDSPVQIEAAPDGVSLELPGEGRSHMEPYRVVVVGSTAFAVGSADDAWPALVWPKKEEPAEEPARAQATATDEDAKPPEEKKGPGKDKKGVGCLFFALVLFFILLFVMCLLGWFFRERISAMLPRGDAGTETAGEAEEHVDSIDALVEKYSLEKSESDGRVLLTGDFATRAERLAATAQAYAAQPEILLDFADRESLKSAVEETLALVGEKELSVVKIAGRVAILSGRALDLRKALEAISEDVPKLANVDCSGVDASVVAMRGNPADGSAAPGSGKSKAARRKAAHPDLPVCGILMSPYPCLVMSNGMRILEGAPMADGAIVKIEPDRVVFTNSTGRVVWKP